jgi:hypothetical protein
LGVKKIPNESKICCAKLSHSLHAIVQKNRGPTGLGAFICVGRFVKLDKFRTRQIYLCVVKKLFDLFGDFEKSKTSNACNFLCAHWKNLKKM